MIKVSICMGSSCFARGNKENLDAVLRYVEQNQLEKIVDLEISGSLCQDKCISGPNMTVNGMVYSVADCSSAIELIKEACGE